MMSHLQENVVSCVFMNLSDVKCMCSNVVDDEEEMLYGDSNTSAAPSKEEMSRSFMAIVPPLSEASSSKAEPSHWCMVTRENGVMEVLCGVYVTSEDYTCCFSIFTFFCLFMFDQIYQLPDWRLVFLVKNFPVGQRVLVDSSSGQSATQGDGKKEEVTRQGEIPLVKEVALVSLGYNHSRPYLLVSF